MHYPNFPEAFASVEQKNLKEGHPFEAQSLSVFNSIPVNQSPFSSFPMPPDAMPDLMEDFGQPIPMTPGFPPIEMPPIGPSPITQGAPPTPTPTPTPVPEPTHTPTPGPEPSLQSTDESSRRTLVETIEYTGPEIPLSGTSVPAVVPKPPHFSVPSNPLLPDEYKEILSYENLQYLNGFLRTQIGKECMVVSSPGSSGNVVTRLGYLIGVGINYLLLQDGCSGAIMAIDFYTVHLVQVMGKTCPVNLNI